CRLDPDLENLLATHAWCAHVADGGERDLSLVTGLFRYFLNRALLSLGWRVTLEALGRAGVQGRQRLRRESRAAAGRVAGRIGRFEASMQSHDEAVAIARQIGAADVLADALTFAAMSRTEHGDLSGARVRAEEGLALARQLGTGSEAFGKASL